MLSLRHHLQTTILSTRSISTLAIAREIPTSFTQALSHHASPAKTVSLSTSKQQHDVYLAELRRHLPTICLAPLESHPDSVFVEDTVVAVGDTALICSLGHASRRGEVDEMKEILLQLGMNVVDMREANDSFCDGGDVLYTGRHLFVGMSERTNEGGFRWLKQVFGETVEVVAVPPVIQGKEVLHLKSAVTHIDEQTILAPTGPLGDNLLETMSTKERGYHAIRVPDMLSCNAVSVNGHILAQDECEVSKETIQKACSERGLGLTFVDTSELAKKDAALTCCSVLLSI